MKIDSVAVTYGELRSSGYPNFSNRRVEITLSAKLEAGETAEQVKDRLYHHARTAVKTKFGDVDAEQTEMDLPF